VDKVNQTRLTLIIKETAKSMVCYISNSFFDPVALICITRRDDKSNAIVNISNALGQKDII
jgi:hypothetical protein